VDSCLPKPELGGQKPSVRTPMPPAATTPPRPLPKVTVAIATYNRAQLLRQALATIVAQDYPPDRVEILVIDGSSTPDTRAAVESFAAANPVPKWIGQTTQGLNHARNRAVREASGEIIVFADDDILAPPDWLRKMALAFGDVSERRVAALGGTVVNVFHDRCPDWLPQWKKPLKFGERLHPLPEGQCPMGANMAFARWVFDQIGLFRADIDGKAGRPTFGDEAELFRRVRRAGYAVWFEPEAAVQHQIPPGRLTLKYACRHAFDSGHSRVVVKLRCESAGRGEALGFLVSRWLANLFKCFALALLCGLCFVLGQPTRGKANLVRAMRAAGYLHAIPLALFRGDWLAAASRHRLSSSSETTLRR